MERGCQEEGKVKVIEETKITLWAGVIISLLSSLIVFVLSVLWLHQTDITQLRTNQLHVLATLTKIDNIPSELAKMNVQLQYLAKTLDDHQRFTLNGNAKKVVK
jgi:hypothetical protein